LQQTEFEQSLTGTEPPPELGAELTAIWWLKNRNWQKAQDLIDKEPGPDAAWVHALLHRMAGDEPNANRWYGRSGRPRENQTIRHELEEMLKHFLD
jgi:hypothetical protein